MRTMIRNLVLFLCLLALVVVAVLPIDMYYDTHYDPYCSYIDKLDNVSLIAESIDGDWLIYDGDLFGDVDNVCNTILVQKYPMLWSDLTALLSIHGFYCKPTITPIVVLCKTKTWPDYDGLYDSLGGRRQKDI